MFSPFESLPDHSRIWIYQASRKLNSQELATISEVLSAFTARWSVHGAPLKSSFAFRFDQFIILAADENSTGVSGCSIDDAVRTINDLGEKLGLDLFNRTLVGIKKDDEIVSIQMADLQKKYLEGVWNNKTLIVNNLVKQKGDLETNWLVPAELTWLKRYLPNEKVAS